MIDMEKIKIDVLVIGTVKADSYCSWWEIDGLNAIGNVSVGSNEMPSEIRFGDRVYDVSQAVIIRAVGNADIRIESLIVPKGKRMLITGSVFAYCKTNK